VPETRDVPATCPRCDTRLIDPGNLGLCPKCGFCSLLEETRAKEVVVQRPVPKPRKLSLLGLVEFLELLGRIPPWMLILLGGWGAVGAVSVAGHLLLPPESPGRTWWAIVQLMIGVVLLFAAQIWALTLVAANEARISPWNLFLLSGRLWGAAVRQLPATRWPIWLASWAVALIVLDLVLIGGLSGEFNLAASRLQRQVSQRVANGSGDSPNDPSSATSSEPAPRDLASYAHLTFSSVTGLTGWLASGLPGVSATPPTGS
jgi:hypothetical protein